MRSDSDAVRLKPEFHAPLVGETLDESSVVAPAVFDDSPRTDLVPSFLASHGDTRCGRGWSMVLRLNKQRTKDDMVNGLPPLGFLLREKK